MASREAWFRAPGLSAPPRPAQPSPPCHRRVGAALFPDLKHFEKVVFTDKPVDVGTCVNSRRERHRKTSLPVLDTNRLLHRFKIMENRRRLLEESGSMAGTIALRCEIHAIFEALAAYLLAGPDLPGSATAAARL